MFYLVGIGLNPRQLTLEALDKVKNCDTVYLEGYTSIFAEGKISELENIIGKRVSVLDRGGVEEGFDKLLDEAKEKNVALLIFGNPLTATTHTQLLLDLEEKKVDYKVLPGISVMSYVGKTGLQEYKFGRTTTIVYHSKNYEPESFYDAILDNKSIGLHTVCLLDIQTDKSRFMTAKEAVEILEKIENKRDLNIIKDSELVVLASVGGKDEKIVSGDLVKIKSLDISVLPQTLIVCGKLNEKEEEALELYA